jgi:hypothetical protein
VSCEVCLAAGQESNGECAKTHAEHMNHLHVKPSYYQPFPGVY